MLEIGSPEPHHVAITASHGDQHTQSIVMTWAQFEDVDLYHDNAQNRP